MPRPAGYNGHYEVIMNNTPDTFNIEDGGLNQRLDRLVLVLDSTNKTLEKVSADIFDANERQSRMQNKFQIFYLVLTAFIVIAASSSAYFAYKSIKISSGQKSLQTVQVILDIVTAVKETIQDLQVTSSSRENIEKSGTTSVKEQNQINQNLGPIKETSQPPGKAGNKN